MNEFLITFRESMEGALIVGIVYTFLVKLNQTRALRFVWAGLGAAVGASLVFGLFLYWLRNEIGDNGYKALFEGVLMYAAAGCLIYMIVWMSRNNNIKQQIESRAASATEGSFFGVFAVVFFGVVREGFETVLFLVASDTQTGSFSYIGAVAGIILASGAGYLIFRQGVKVPVKKLFNYSSVLLIVLAAGMVAYGTHEFEDFIVEEKIMGEIKSSEIARPYDILKPSKTAPESLTFYTQNPENGKYYHWLHDNGAVGVYLKGFFGYNSNPNWVELFLWALTLFGGYFLWRRFSAQPTPQNKNTINEKVRLGANY